MRALPRVQIAHLPTRIERLERLEAELGGPELWVKRDDQTGLAFGGNKTRKLEYSLGEALQQGAKTLVTTGAIQSNHCRQTAALAARYGLGCVLVLSGDPPAHPDGNLLLNELLGAELIWTTRERRDQTLAETVTALAQAGRKPFGIPLGASDAVGAVGYVTAWQEFMAQEASFDRVIVASSSAGTQAGMALGAKISGWGGQVLGISIDHSEAELQASVASLANAAAARLGLDARLRPDEVAVNADYLGAGYGILGAGEAEAIRLFARMEGLLLDPVYTGRAAAAMIDLIRRGQIRRGERVLFWHTGGGPALFAEGYARSLSR
jgi:D-cysteine desulfhydrase family pyridoxal phosphate-dependent enzyme